MMASQQEKAFCVLRFEVSRSVITVQREFCARFRTAGSASVSFVHGLELLVAHEKLGQLPLLTVYDLPV
jgi:hypothetical protein